MFGEGVAGAATTATYVSVIGKKVESALVA
jgi:hypothetical protein